MRSFKSNENIHKKEGGSYYVVSANKASVRFDSCDKWIHNECSFIAETPYETVNNSNCTWICPKCEFFNFSGSFFGEQVNLETENRFVPLTKEKKARSSPCGTNKSSFIGGLKFISMNINSIRGKKLELLLAFLDFHRPHVVAIQETKIDNSIATSELLPETCPYSVYRKDRNIHGGRVMLLVHKDISHMPITELENDSKSIWVKVFANKTSHFVANWYQTHAKAKKTGSSKLRSKFETLRRESKADVRKQHNMYVNNLVGDVKANPRDFYQYINSQKKDIQSILPLKRKNGKGVVQSDLEKAEEFNGQFTDVFNKNEHTQVLLLDRSAPFMKDIAVSKDGVIKLLKGLNPSKALGPDELHPRVLKELATELGPVFAHLFQQSVDTGEILKEWSLANICPLFKKSDRSLAYNYRPVSLTCVPCKLLKHIVCSNIMAHLDEHKLLSDRQHAFRKGHSCETQLTTVINDWAKILDNRGQVDTFILDFEKAFDTPPHELLKSKLFSYGIGGKTLKWIDSFLCFRQQLVVVNGVKSAPVLSGVPQGTVLGPLLFSLYINDISSDIESEIRLFADDCVCYREIKDEEDTMKLQSDID